MMQEKTSALSLLTFTTYSTCVHDRDTHRKEGISYETMVYYQCLECNLLN